MNKERAASLVAGLCLETQAELVRQAGSEHSLKCGTDGSIVIGFPFISSVSGHTSGTACVGLDMLSAPPLCIGHPEAHKLTYHYAQDVLFQGLVHRREVDGCLQVQQYSPDGSRRFS